MRAISLPDGGSVIASAVPVVVELPARVSGQCLRALRGQLLAGLRHPGGFVVDCRRVQELSPAALALLVATHRAARLRGVTWRLEQPSATMLTALRRSGLSHLLVPAAGRAVEPPPSGRCSGWSEPTTVSCGCWAGRSRPRYRR